MYHLDSLFYNMEVSCLYFEGGNRCHNKCLAKHGLCHDHQGSRDKLDEYQRINRNYVGSSISYLIKKNKEDKKKLKSYVAFMEILSREMYYFLVLPKMINTCYSKMLECTDKLDIPEFAPIYVSIFRPPVLQYLKSKGIKINKSFDSKMHKYIGDSGVVIEDFYKVKI